MGAFARQAMANRLLVSDSRGNTDACSGALSAASTPRVSDDGPAQVSASTTTDPTQRTKSAARPNNHPASAASTSQPPSSSATQLQPSTKGSGFAKPALLHTSGSKVSAASRTHTLALDDRDKQV
jgi:hypothetical protein